MAVVLVGKTLGRGGGDRWSLPGLLEKGVCPSGIPAIRRPLERLRAVGLGYLRLGQASPTLSGGEAQRIKLVAERALARSDAEGRAERPTLYVLDARSVGLHMADVERRIAVLQRLVDAGHSVLVTEHDLDLIADADWVVDLGPKGGRRPRRDRRERRAARCRPGGYRVYTAAGALQPPGGGLAG